MGEGRGNYHAWGAAPPTTAMTQAVTERRLNRRVQHTTHTIHLAIQPHLQPQLVIFSLQREQALSLLK